MSPIDTVMPLFTAPWPAGADDHLQPAPLPGLRPQAVASVAAHWSGVLTPEMRQLLQLSCGLAGTPLGSVDFTGRWYPEEPLAVLRPSLTLAIDDRGCRWIAETTRKRGLPGPVWCVFPRPEVAMFIDKSLGDFLLRLNTVIRRDWASQWLKSLTIRARALWATRHARAIAVPAAFTRLKEIRGWLASLPLDAWVYDLRAPGHRRGLPYGLAHERGAMCRCGRLPVFAFVGVSGPAALASERLPEVETGEGSVRALSRGHGRLALRVLEEREAA